ncbi:MAG: ATP-binding protein [Thermoguttaceae bacterium]|nr:ATP-binding protein [Thermoguttaceae bacterium]
MSQEANLFSAEQWAWYRDVVINSDSTDAVRPLLDEILNTLMNNGWENKLVFGIHLSMEEALVNAVKHGNKYNPAKKVHVRVGISSNLFRSEITDEGEGFDPAKLPDPTDPDYLDKPNGRGVMLMRNFMTRVVYNDCGNAVFMEKVR